MANETVRKAYEPLAGKYKLPAYDEINRVFEIETIEETGFLLRHILQQMYETLERYTKILEDVLQPDSNLAGLVESGALSEEHKRKLYKVFRAIMYLNRKAIATAASSSEEEEATTIKLIMQSWQNIAPELVETGTLLADAWKKEDKQKPEVQGYLG